MLDQKYDNFIVSLDGESSVFNVFIILQKTLNLKIIERRFGIKEKTSWSTHNVLISSVEALESLGLQSTNLEAMLLMINGKQKHNEYAIQVLDAFKSLLTGTIPNILAKRRTPRSWDFGESTQDLKAILVRGIESIFQPYSVIDYELSEGSMFNIKQDRKK